MEIRNEIKSILARNGLSMTDVVNGLNQKYGRNDSVQNLSNKMTKGTLRYSEVMEIADVIGHEIHWIKKSEASS